MKDKAYLYNWFNATCTDDGNGDVETYENWLERQLLSRIKRLEQLDCACKKQKPSIFGHTYKTCTKCGDTHLMPN